MEATITAGTLARVEKLIRALGCDAPSILPNHDLCNDLGIDSTELVELAGLVRREFGLSGSTLTLLGARTVADIAARVDAAHDQ